MRAFLRFAWATLVLVSVAACTQQISSEELARRVAQSRPQWQNYQEDIKGQIGAAEAAEWQGKPTEAVQQDRVIHVRFDVTGPWATRNVAIPVLLRDPTGTVIQNDAFFREDQSAVYAFTLPGTTTDTVPWVEVQFPHGQRRLALRTSS